MFHHEGMKRVTVRDLRQRWPEVERMLAREGEIEITRDGKPVARLLPSATKPKKRKRFDFAEHEKWLRETWGNRVVNIVDAAIAEEREDD